MNGREADAKWAIEKKIILDELSGLSRAEKIDLIQKAREYRSGQDSCNSVYMGGIATSMLRHKLADGGTWEESLDRSTDKQLMAGLDVCAGTIQYMRKNPVTKCPCCGQIVSAKKVGAA